ncbi:hypothetical protein [Pseudoalteromonas sp. HL-AS1]|uniref:hypothetical protein n=1 Tax=Pseudoalteromonas sp. HL-AS1 TaxID=3071081 RepID=UPI002814E6BC|nr:hypothetical protein [Pseudoalteromonas sp. HL-AS1]WMS91373.1 hypothetical protein RB214_02855 [Pseudoalteromonas sp. HL-AS1]WMT83673.1 holin [Pseudoalteromonas phage ACA1]WMT83725.1 holin [Pseudoalteromonas phage ACA2]WMT83777.1 holin [Pseudoalteromonas phage proACA1-A]
MGWFKTLVSFITDPIADLTGGYVERKRIAAEMAADVARAENNFKIAQFEAKARRCMQAEQNDADYDLLVLKNRDKTLMDELIILFFLGLFICHFIPAMQPYMHKGWQSMGYKGAPWYFEFVIVGIAVSTLGLMRLFRAFWGGKAKGNKSAS